VRSPMEGMHADALRGAAAAARLPPQAAGDGVFPDAAGFDAAYLRCMDALLDEYLDDLALEGFAAGPAA